MNSRPLPAGRAYVLPNRIKHEHASNGNISMRSPSSNAKMFKFAFISVGENLSLGRPSVNYCLRIQKVFHLTLINTDFASVVVAKTTFCTHKY